MAMGGCLKKISHMSNWICTALLPHGDSCYYDVMAIWIDVFVCYYCFYEVSGIYDDGRVSENDGDDESYCGELTKMMNDDALTYNCRERMIAQVEMVCL